MGHRRTPQVDSDLDDIWYYVATQSGSMEIADRFIDSITDRFFLLARHPNIGSLAGHCGRRRNTGQTISGVRIENPFARRS
jgi:plasmid stabilization system protein ParE